MISQLPMAFVVCSVLSSLGVLILFMTVSRLDKQEQ